MPRGEPLREVRLDVWVPGWLADALHAAAADEGLTFSAWARRTFARALLRSRIAA